MCVCGGGGGGSIKETIVSSELSLLVSSDQPALNCYLTGENLLSRSFTLPSRLYPSFDIGHISHRDSRGYQICKMLRSI